MEHAKVKLLNYEIQKKELLAFEEKGTTNGSFSYSAPSGLHDDCVMALAMAWDACSKMNGTPAVIIRAGDPIEEMEKVMQNESSTPDWFEFVML